MLIPQGISTPIDQSNPFSRIEMANLAPVSDGARNLLSQLVKWSGKKGYCFWSIPKIALKLSRSESTIRRRKQELIQAKLLLEIPRPGRSSYLIPFPENGDSEGNLQLETPPLSILRPPFLKKTKN